MTDKNTWRISYKIGDFNGTLASCKVEGHTQFLYKGREAEFAFDATEAEFLHQALGAILGAQSATATAIAVAAPSVDAAPMAVEKPKTNSDKASSNAGRRWTEEDDAKLIALFNNGKQTLDMLSAEFNRSPAAIASRLFKHDLIEMRPKTKPTV